MRDDTGEIKFSIDKIDRKNSMNVPTSLRRTDSKLYHFVELRDNLGPLDIDLSPSDTKLIEYPENEEQSGTELARRSSLSSCDSLNNEGI